MRPVVCLVLGLLFLPIQNAYAWSNGGYSTSPSNPLIGTHDWIVMKAVELMPVTETAVFKDNMNWLKYGTELLDRPKNMSGYDDHINHHVYFDEQKRPVDDAAARRANEIYNQALNLLKTGNFSGGVMMAGAMSHYISDVAVWGHLMGADTPWGVEKHHSDYEGYVNEHMFLFSTAQLGLFNRTSAYQATMDLASYVMFVSPNATWMDNHYNWSDQRFTGQVTGTLNMAANYVAQVLHTLWLDAGQPIPELSTVYYPLIAAVATIFILSRRQAPPKQLRETFESKSLILYQ